MEKEIVGLPTGFKALDEKLGGFRKGEVVVITSRPSVGKTSLAMNIAECLSLGHDINGIPFVGKSEGRHAVLYFSLEMSSASFAKRMLCSRAHINAWHLERDVIDEAESATVKVAVADAANEMGQTRLYVEDTANLDIEELCKKAKSMTSNSGIELVVVDYLQFFNSKTASQGGRKSELSHVFAHLKLMARELNVPVIVLVQLFKRIDRDKLPTLPDLRDVAVIEKDADVVMLLHRTPPYYGSEIKVPEEDIAILDIAKNHKGETGKVRMTFSREFMRFGNASDEYLKEPFCGCELNPPQVAMAVADVTSVPLDEICNCNKTHEQKVADARGLAIYLARKCTVQSLPEIAEFFKCTHVQILSISKKMRTRLLADESLRGQLDAIVARMHAMFK